MRERIGHTLRRFEKLKPLIARQIPGRFEIDHLKRLLRYLEVDCIFDIGACSGQYAGRLRSAVKFKGTILSFEPHPEMFARLQQRAAKDPNWHVYRLALSDEPGWAEFNIAGSDLMGSLSAPSADAREILPMHTRVVRTEQVEAVRLSDLYPDMVSAYGFARPFLKMDTQGFDMKIAQGSEEVLPKFVGLQSELAVVRLYEDSPDYLSALDYYQSQGFALSALVPNSAGHFPRMLEVDCVMLRRDLL